MFAYCNNNPVNMVDTGGGDAVWIQEERSAGFAGHTGLMVQDADGRWWYFYWGPDDSDKLKLGETVSIVSGNPATNGCFLVPVDTTSDSLKSLDGVKDAVTNTISNSEYGSSDRYNNISGSIYLTGDYSATFDYLSQLVGNRNSRPYYLYFDNCVQETIFALSKSNKLFLLLCSTIITATIPNAAFYAVKASEKAKSLFDQ